MNPTAQSFFPKWVSPPVRPTRTKYTKSQLLSMKEPALDAVRNGPIENAPPFREVPATLVPFLSLRHSMEFVDVERATALVEANAHAQRDDPAANYFCVTCSNGPNACAVISSLVTTFRKREQQNLLGAFLFQPGRVVMGLVQLRLVFDHKKSSLLMRSLPERCPKAVALIRDFLCGEGFHIPPPPITAHEQWKVLNQKLKFDFIRDSRTIVYTELSKYWKKSHTQFEQFAHFLFYRDDIPHHRTKNMITHAQKPVLVSVISGDMDALILLCELGFFVPPDYYWSFPFFQQSVAASGVDPKRHAILRHICVYYYQKQSHTNVIGQAISPPNTKARSENAPETALEALMRGLPQAEAQAPVFE